ncbi:MAG: hypothetical protein ACR2JO_12220 [Mycobacteriales bacterium]
MNVGAELRFEDVTGDRKADAIAVNTSGTPPVRGQLALMLSKAPVPTTVAYWPMEEPPGAHDHDVRWVRTTAQLTMFLPARPVCSIAPTVFSPIDHFGPSASQLNLGERDFPFGVNMVATAHAERHAHDRDGQGHPSATG